MSININCQWVRKFSYTATQNYCRTKSRINFYKVILLVEHPFQFLKISNLHVGDFILLKAPSRWFQNYVFQRKHLCSKNLYSDSNDWFGSINIRQATCGGVKNKRQSAKETTWKMVKTQAALLFTNWLQNGVVFQKTSYQHLPELVLIKQNLAQLLSNRDLSEKCENFKDFLSRRIYVKSILRHKNSKKF